MPNNSSSSAMIFDEGAFLLGGRYDSIKEALRNVSGIPNATYKVMGEEVFVYEALVKSVFEQMNRQNGLGLAEVAHLMLPAAIMSPLKAVKDWNITPYPYQRIHAPSGGWYLRHKPFNARTPNTYHDHAKFLEVVVSLLMGEKIEGEGDFVYDEVPLVLEEPLSIESLPPKPLLEGEKIGKMGPAGGGINYMAGFPPLTPELHSEVSRRLTAWDVNARRVAVSIEPLLPAVLAGLPIDLIRMTEDAIGLTCDQDHEKMASLRTLYPEIRRIQSEYLYEIYDNYQFERWFSSDWAPDREVGFIFYLLGKFAKPEAAGDDACSLGLWFAHARDKGLALEEATVFALASLQYDRALHRLDDNIKMAISYLKKAVDGERSTGQPIVTIADAMRLARTVNSRVVVHQDLQGLAQLDGAS